MKVLDIAEFRLDQYIFSIQKQWLDKQNNFSLLQQPYSHSVLEYCSMLNFLTRDLVYDLRSGNSNVGHSLSIIISFSEKSPL